MNRYIIKILGSDYYSSWRYTAIESTKSIEEITRLIRDRLKEVQAHAKAMDAYVDQNYNYNEDVYLEMVDKSRDIAVVRFDRGGIWLDYDDMEHTLEVFELNDWFERGLADSRIM